VANNNQPKRPLLHVYANGGKSFEYYTKHGTDNLLAILNEKAESLDKELRVTREALKRAVWSLLIETDEDMPTKERVAIRVEAYLEAARKEHNGE
jgi:hypothetical protein